MKYSDATQERPVFLFFDELVYSKDWDLWLKTFFDEKYPVQIAASSSSTAAIRHRHLESGVGRWEEQFLAPYLFGEYLSLINQPIVVPVDRGLSQTLLSCINSRIDISKAPDLRRQFLLRGGFPEILAHEGSGGASDSESILLQSQKMLRVDAVERAIYKDIPQAFGVDNPMLVEIWMEWLSPHSAGIYLISRDRFWCSPWKIFPQRNPPSKDAAGSCILSMARLEMPPSREDWHLFPMTLKWGS
jgi:hypothetical protein